MHGDPLGQFWGKQGAEKGFNPSPKDGFNFLHMVMAAHAFTIQVFVRRGMGHQMMNKRACLGLLLFGPLAVFSEDPSLLAFLVVFFVVVPIRRLQAYLLRLKGWRVHSWSEGQTLLNQWLGWSQSAGIQFEATLCFVGSYVIGSVGVAYRLPLIGLALYIGFGTLSIAFDAACTRYAVARKVREMEDAEIEAEEVMEAFQRRRR